MFLQFRLKFVKGTSHKTGWLGTANHSTKTSLVQWNSSTYFIIRHKHWKHCSVAKLWQLPLPADNVSQARTGIKELDPTQSVETNDHLLIAIQHGFRCSGVQDWHRNSPPVGYRLCLHVSKNSEKLLPSRLHTTKSASLCLYTGHQRRTYAECFLDYGSDAPYPLVGTAYQTCPNNNFSTNLSNQKDDVLVRKPASLRGASLQSFVHLQASPANERTHQGRPLHRS